MFLVSTRNFPPEIGGIQNLMEGLSNALLNHGPVKVFADEADNSSLYDQHSKLNIERGKMQNEECLSKKSLYGSLAIISKETEP